MKKYITFGEIMLRLKPPNWERFFQSPLLEATFGGGEAKVFDGASWFHISGITPAISLSASELSLEAVKKAREKGIIISCDLNFIINF